MRVVNFCPQGPAFPQMVIMGALIGCGSAQARWHACKRGGLAALGWQALPVRWFAWWARWLYHPVAAHYGDTLDDFVMDDSVVLLRLGRARGME